MSKKLSKDKKSALICSTFMNKRSFRTDEIMKSNSSKPMGFIPAIVCVILVCVTLTFDLYGQTKLNAGQLEQLQQARTVSIIFEKPRGSAFNVNFPVIESLKGLFPPAGLKVVSSGGDIVFKIRFNATANSRRYSRIGGNFAQTGYTGASVSGRVFLLVGEVQFLMKYFSGKENTKSTIAKGTYTSPSNAPFKKAFMKSSVRKVVMEILGMFNADPTALFIAYLEGNDLYARRDSIILLESSKDPRVPAALHTMIRDEEDKVRLQLARSLGSLRDSSSVVPLLNMLTDKNSQVRKEVLKSLDQIDSKWRESHAAKQMVPDWITLLNDKNWGIQTGALKALMEAYSQDVLKPMIRSMMNSSSTRREVVKFLDKKDPDWKSSQEAVEAVDYFIENLSQGSRTHKQDTAGALGEIGNQRAVAPLINQLKDPDRMVRSNTLFILEKNFPDWGKNPAAVALVPYLLKLLSDRISEVKIVAIGALSAIDDSRVTPALLRMLKDRNYRVKNRAVKALGDCSDPSVIKPLIGMLKAVSKSTREEAVEALGKKQDPLVVEPLIRVLKSDRYSSTRRKAAEALGEIKDTRVFEPLLAALKDSDDFVIAAAARALGKQKDQRALDILLELSDSKKYRIRSAANHALKDLISELPPDRLKPFLNGRNSDLKKYAVEALVKLRSPDTIALLNEVMLDEKEDVKIKAIDALATIEDPQTIKPLIAALNDDNYKISVKAAKVLGERKEPESIVPLIEVYKKSVSVKTRTGVSRTSYTGRLVRDTTFKALMNMSDSLNVRQLLDMHTVQDYNNQQKILTLLIQTKDPEATDVYIQVLNGKYPGSKNMVLGILGARKDKRAIAAIIECLKSNSRYERKKAAHSLTVITGLNFGTSYKKWKKWWKKNQ